MRYKLAGFSHVGAIKPSNQDSYVVQHAISDKGELAFMLVADGVSSLSFGELASATLARLFSEWFSKDLPLLVEVYEPTDPAFFHAFKLQMHAVLLKVHVQFLKYARTKNTQMGSTLTALLCWDKNYYALHVGDSRIARIRTESLEAAFDSLEAFENENAPHSAYGNLQTKSHIDWLTQDQVEATSNTLAFQGATHQGKLSNCVGVTEVLKPQFLQGAVQDGDVFLVCSDGFYRGLSDEEFIHLLGCDVLRGWAAKSVDKAEEAGVTEDMQAKEDSKERFPQIAKQHFQRIASMLMARGEKDNMTAAILLAQSGTKDCGVLYVQENCVLDIQEYCDPVAEKQGVIDAQKQSVLHAEKRGVLC